ncbi:hypothetical protein L0337_40985 [candidate division KSB1 bacterium]|nr:hypothetical protein [candidate division KSB1 bacterium]
MVNCKYVVVLLFLLVPSLDGQVHAQEFTYQRYDDRYEGVLKERIPVGGETLKLISAAIVSHESSSQMQSGQYHLALFVEDSSRVTVRVQAQVPKIQHIYKMVPIFKSNPPGIRPFSWPATIPMYYNLTIDMLLPLAEVKGSAGTKIVPILLYSQAKKHATPRYRFCVVPSGSVSVLNYHVYNTNGATPIYSDTLKDLPYEEQVFLIWEGRNQSGITVKNGWYKLIIEASFKALPGETPHVLVVQYEFYHYNEIFRSIGATQ